MVINQGGQIKFDFKEPTFGRPYKIERRFIANPTGKRGFCKQSNFEIFTFALFSRENIIVINHPKDEQCGNFDHDGVNHSNHMTLKSKYANFRDHYLCVFC